MNALQFASMEPIRDAAERTFRRYFDAALRDISEASPDVRPDGTPVAIAPEQFAIKSYRQAHNEIAATPNELPEMWIVSYGPHARAEANEPGAYEWEGTLAVEVWIEHADADIVERALNRIGAAINAVVCFDDGPSELRHICDPMGATFAIDTSDPADTTPQFRGVRTSFDVRFIA